jgi:hypothetical protein
MGFQMASLRHQATAVSLSEHGVESRFTNRRDPEGRSRRIFHFHQPGTSADWVAAESVWLPSGHRLNSAPAGLRLRLQQLPERTFTAISSIYRLIKYGGARRLLFLVDRGNLGRQAEKEARKPARLRYVAAMIAVASSTARKTRRSVLVMASRLRWRGTASAEVREGR